jgi:hypothetical protein
MDTLAPWEIHPELTDARLRVVARILRDTRRQAVVSVYDPVRGDSAWGLGCVVYERSCFALAKAAQTSPFNEWLTVLEDDGLKFSFAVGGVPLRFFRGDTEGTAPGRTLRIRVPELQAQQLSFLNTDDEESDLLCRLIIEVDETGQVARIAFARVARDGGLQDVWAISHEGEGAILLFDTAEPIEIAPPIIGPLRVTQEIRPAEERKGA